MTKLIYHLILLSLISSCNCQNRKFDEPNTIFLLKRVDSVLFASEKIHFQNCYIGYDNSSFVEFLYFADAITKKIYKFSYKEKKINKEIDIPQKNFILKGFYVYKSDSIFIQDSKLFRYFLINNQGFSFDSIIIPPVKMKPLPYIGNNHPVYCKGSAIYLAGYAGGEYSEEKRGDRPVVTKFNRVNKTVSYCCDYPEFYYSSNFGGLHYRKVFNAFNSEQDVIVISFPASGDLYIYNMKDESLSNSQGPTG